jgi:hypothetical protein
MRDICQFVANKLFVDETHYASRMLVRGESQRKLIYRAIDFAKSEDRLLVTRKFAK